MPDLKAVLHQLATELENIWIEKEVCRNLIEVSCIVTPDVLAEHTQKALSDPQIRQQTHERFAQMWKALEEGANEIVTEDLLNSPPPSGKPN